MKVLIANRGEIAVRIVRSCRELGIPSVAVHTDVDQLALHVRYADEAVSLGQPGAYLDGARILDAAQRSGATAIHPGYGFLAENAAFARQVEDAGLIFIGPRPETIHLLGNKLAARQAATSAGLPVLPGSDSPLTATLPAKLAAAVSYPVLVKAVAGGGGRGIRLAHSAAELPQMVAAARQEALAAFGDGAVFLESLVQAARHIEVQILGDGRGRVVCLGERECSIQRRRQKLIEEAPAVGLPESIRARLGDAALRLGRRLRYRGLGTVEFLLDAANQFHFIEVNPRIQVEHPVTEMVTGMDLVREQLLIALGEPLRSGLERVEARGAAIEVRVLAEDPAQGFLPVTGQIKYLKEPGGPGIRVDSALYQGLEVGADYDSLLAKVIAWGADRASANRRLLGALAEFQLGGLANNLEFLQQIVASPDFATGSFTTSYLDAFQPALPQAGLDIERTLAVAAALYAEQRRQTHLSRQPLPGNQWQQAAWREQMHGRG
jgi:acetyl/propionyl-CoA carboxylase alpha subunit